MDKLNENCQSWRLNRNINISTIIQLVFLASLIIGSWVNLQRQFDLLSHDMALLLKTTTKFEQKLETLNAKSISYEYRLQALEKTLTKTSYTRGAKL